MRKFPVFFMATAIAVCLLWVTACVKPPVDFNPRDGNVTLSATRIERIIGTYYPYQDGSDDRTFTYNAANDPVSVVPTYGNIGTGNPAYSFLYDKKGRPTEVIGFYSDRKRYEVWYRFVYENGRIVRDTVSGFGIYGESSPPALTAVEYLAYDALDRIVVDSVVSRGTVEVVYHYSYDYNGNLVTGKTYDNKLNPHRTNKIWMFLDRNYSVNNIGHAASYNSYGLPLVYDTSHQGFVSFLGHDFFVGNIYYNHN